MLVLINDFSLENFISYIYRENYKYYKKLFHFESKFKIENT